MSATRSYVNIPMYDPNTSVFSPTRPVEGIVKCRAATLDVDFTEYARWIMVNISGSLSYIGWDGITVNIPNIAAGVFHPIYATRINSSGTTATTVMWGN